MRKGFNTRLPVFVFILLILPVTSIFAKFWVNIKNINTGEPITKSPYIVSLKTYQIEGLEFTAHFENESSDKTITCWLRRKPGSEPIPDYVDGWNDFEVNLKPGQDTVFTNVIFIRPSEAGADNFVLEIARRLGLNPRDPISANREEIIVRTINSSLEHPVILSEPSYTRGTRNSVKWIPVEGSRMQEVYYFDDADRKNLRKAVKGLYKALLSDTLTETFNNLKNGHKYGFFAKAVYETENGEEAYYSDIVYSVQDNTPPETIIEPQAIMRYGKVVVSWNLIHDELSGVGSYRIYRTADSGIEKRLAEINAEWLSSGQWIDTSAVGGHYYAYRIRAVDKVGNEGSGDISNDIFVEGSEDIVIDYDTTDVTKDNRNGDFIYGTVDTIWVRLDNREKFIRFESVRDSSGYFSNPPSSSMRYYDSGWIEPDSLRQRGWLSTTNYDSVFFVFDYSRSKNVQANDQGGLETPLPETVEIIDKNLVNGHKYIRRFLRKYYSTVHTEDAGSIIPDCFPPEDIHNLKANSVMQDAAASDPAQGFSSYLMYLSWEKASDDASGLKRYHIYRKIGSDGKFDELPLPDDFINVSYVDTLSRLVLNDISNPMVSYRVVAEDAVGNERNIDSTEWEAVERIPGKPVLVFTTTEYSDIYPSDPLQADTVFTHEKCVELSIRNFDTSGIVSWTALVNGQQTDPYDVINNNIIIVKLPDDEVSNIKVRGVYTGKISSVWSTEKVVIRALTIAPKDVTVRTDTNSWDGDIYMQWKKPCIAAQKYLILRKTAQSGWSLTGSVLTATDTIKWVDRYASNELTEENGDILVAYRDYEYKVKMVNIMGDTSIAVLGNIEYCNKPPEISSNETPKIENGNYVLSIHWDRVSPSDASEGYTTVVRIYADSLEGPYEEEIVVDTTAFYCRTAVMNTNYIFRIKEIPNKPVGKESAWSKPYIVPGLVHLPLEVIPQPEGCIYVNWNAPDLIKKYKIERYIVLRNNDAITYINKTATSFMDSAKFLIHSLPYTYKVEALNRLGQVVAVGVKSDTSDTGSVYIPEISENMQKYFKSDSVNVSWNWKDRYGKPVSGTTRGAETCMIQVSVSRYFSGNRNETSTIGPFSVNPGLTSRKVKIPVLANRINNKIYFRITAFDKFGNTGNPPALWSTDFYNLKTAVYDTVPPYPVTKISVDSVHAYYGASDSIMVSLSWDGAGIQTAPADNSIAWDQLRGNVAEYRIKRITESGVTDAGSIPVNKNSVFYVHRDILSNRNIKWSISVVDSAGNITDGTEAASQVFLPTPLPPEPVDKKKCTIPVNTNQPDTAYYFVEMAMNPGHFSIAYELKDEDMMNRLLCRSGWIDASSYECTSGWGAIENDTTWFRLKTGVKQGDKWWESGWSAVSFIVSGQNSTNKSTGIGDVAEVPKFFRVGQNYPNPFNSETVIPFQLPYAAKVNVSIYNISGSIVKTVENSIKNAGFHSARWNGMSDAGTSVSSGIYICVVTASGKDGKTYQSRKKLMFVK